MNIRTPSVTATVQRWSNDAAVRIFGGLTVAALAASFPATWSVAVQFHTADWLGALQSLAWVLLFEAGALASLLAVLWISGLTVWLLYILHAGLLLVVAVANYRAAAHINPAANEVELLIFAALVPVLTFLFSHLLVGRLCTLKDPPQGSLEETVATTANEVITVLMTRAIEELRQPLLPAPTQSHAREAVQPGPVLPVCVACGAQGNRGHALALARHGRWVCPSCGRSSDTDVGAGSMRKP